MGPIGRIGLMGRMESARGTWEETVSAVSLSFRIMDKNLWERLESAVCSRNPKIGPRLQPGLNEEKIKKWLAKANLTGAIQPIVELYSWKDGMRVDFELRASKAGFFPGQNYFFDSLDKVSDTLRFMKAADKNRPESRKLGEGINRYFPFMCNGAVKFISVDLDPSHNNRIMLIDMDAESPFREAYGTFNEFIEDVIRANTENVGLSCFGK